MENIHPHPISHLPYSLEPHPGATGAVTASLGDSGVTHLVVANSVDAQDVPPASSRFQVVKQQWFWESIQIEACADEALYQAKVGGVSVASFPIQGDFKPGNEASFSLVPRLHSPAFFSSV